MICRAQRQIAAIRAALAAEKALAVVDRKAADHSKMIEQRAEGIRRSAITVVNGAGSRRLRDANRRIRAARKEALKRDHMADQQILQRGNAVLGREHAIEAKLASLARAFGDLTPLMETLGGVLETQTSERFDAETAPDGTRWKPSLRARQDGRKTLTDRTTLRRSIHSVASRSRVEIGTNLIYAGVHQSGAKIRAKTSAGLRFQLPGKLGWRRVMEVEIPARPFLGLSQDNAEELLEEIEAYALDALGGDA